MPQESESTAIEAFCTALRDAVSQLGAVVSSPEWQAAIARLRENAAQAEVQVGEILEKARRDRYLPGTRLTRRVR